MEEEEMIEEVEMMVEVEEEMMEEDISISNIPLESSRWQTPNKCTRQSYTCGKAALISD